MCTQFSIQKKIPPSLWKRDISVDTKSYSTSCHQAIKAKRDSILHSPIIALAAVYIYNAKYTKTLPDN